MKITDNAGYRNLWVIRILSYGETQHVAARLAEYSERFEIKKSQNQNRLFGMAAMHAGFTQVQ